MCQWDANKVYMIAYEWVNPPDFFDDDVPDSLINYYACIVADEFLKGLKEAD